MSNTQIKRVIIISANPIFREGLRKMYDERWVGKASIVGIAANMTEAFMELESKKPDLVIVDFDDKNINRSDFLNSFITGKTNMQVILVSLQESGQVLVYDRRALTSSQAESWLNDLWK